MSRIKIDATELATFQGDALKVDPYWSDLYNPKPIQKFDIVTYFQNRTQKLRNVT